MQKVQFSLVKHKFLQACGIAEGQLGSHLDSKIGLEGGQEAPRGQLEGPRGVQVALGGQFARAKRCLEASLKCQVESKWRL